MAGTLFIVATPIGNLEDITLRALQTLRTVDLIAAEDTRRTAKLLAHHGIHRPMVSLHAHNEHREAPRLLEKLIAGTSIALVSDAGTPGIADPGEHLVRLARDQKVSVTPIPGPSAIAAALSVSGLPASEFVFLGFVPRSGTERKDWFERAAAEPRTVVAFETPHRIASTVRDLHVYMVNRPIQLHREISKIHEEFAISHTSAVDPVVEKGEFVIIVGPGVPPPETGTAEQAKMLDMAVIIIGCMTINGVFERDEAIRLASKAVGIAERAVKNAYKKHRIQSKQRGQPLS